MAQESPARPPRSKLGVASFLIAVGLMALCVGLLVVSMVLDIGGYHRGPPGLVDRICGLYLVAVMPLGFLTGLVLGIVGLTRRDHRRGHAVAGIVLNGLFGIVGLLLVLAGLSGIVAH